MLNYRQETFETSAEFTSAEKERLTEFDDAVRQVGMPLLDGLAGNFMESLLTIENNWVRDCLFYAKSQAAPAAPWP